VKSIGHREGTGDIAISGGGPAALVLAVALARRGIPTTVFERDAHPEAAPRFNPDPLCSSLPGCSRCARFYY